MDPWKSPAPTEPGEAEYSPFIGEIGESSDAAWPTEAAQRWADFERPFVAMMERSRGFEAELAMQVEEVDPLEEDEPTRWLGTPEQIAFRERVLQAHTEASRKRKGAPIADLADTDQAPVTGTGICMARDAAAAAERLLSAARAALAEAQRTGHADALKTLGIAASSGYRNRAHQERLWKGYFDGSMRKPKGYYDETAAVRATLPEGEHGDAAVDYMLRTFRIPDRIAAPGYSNHQAGLAIDLLQKRVKGERIFNSTGTRSVRKWESTWLFEWLLANAGAFGFERYRKEPWHWTYRSTNAESTDEELTYTEPATHREIDLEDGDFEAAPVDEWEESELWDARAVSENFEEAEDPELVAATVAYEAQSAAFEVSDLVGLEVEDLAPTDELYESEDPLGFEELFETEEFTRKRASGPPLWLSPGCVQKLKGLSVAVVGGGFAGLMAARTLCQQGMKVTVFEARAQVGGRVLSNTTFSRDRITEAGAELVGSIHTRWCQLAIEYGLTLISRMDGDLYRGQGLDQKLTLDKPLSNDEIKALGIEMEDRVLRPIAQLASNIGDPSQPWLDHGLRKYDNTSVADELANRYGVKRTERLWKAMEMLLVNNNVARLEELNFLGLLCLVKGGQPAPIWDPLMGYWNELEIYRCADGCQQLAIKIAKEIQTRYRGKVLRRRAITHIDLSKGVSLASKVVRRDGKLEDGKPSIERFDYVILAIPPSVWADVKITPVHPKEPSVVGLMGMGDAVKFFSDVKDRFWITDKAAPYGGSLTLGQVWEGTDNQTRVGDQGIVLSVFAGARSSTPDQKDQFKRELTKLYPNYPRRLNKTMFANWPKEPFIRTGYTSPKLGQIFTVGKALNEPFQGRLFFAGEHTQMDHFGYMEGALRSGERAAQLLMQHACEPPPVLVASVAPKREAEDLWQESAHRR